MRRVGPCGVYVGNVIFGMSSFFLFSVFAYITYSFDFWHDVYFTKWFLTLFLLVRFRWSMFPIFHFFFSKYKYRNISKNIILFIFFVNV